MGCDPAVRFPFASLDDNNSTRYLVNPLQIVAAGLVGVALCHRFIEIAFLYRNSFFNSPPAAAVADFKNASQQTLAQGLKHAARGPHVAREGLLCGPRCFLGLFK